MKSLALSLTTVLLAAVAVRAEAPAADADEKTTVVKFRLHPAAAPVPALRYKLLPDLRDRRQGNAALLYYRAFAPEWYVGTGKFIREPGNSEKMEKWREEMP